MTAAAEPSECQYLIAPGRCLNAFHHQPMRGPPDQAEQKQDQHHQQHDAERVRPEIARIVAISAAGKEQHQQHDQEQRHDRRHPI